MGRMTNRNACKGGWVLVLVVLVGVQLGIAEDDDQPGRRQSTTDLSGVSADERTSIAENHDIARIRQAAEQGQAKAQYSLGRIYRDGDRVLQDYVKAHAWLNLAAAEGKEDARKARDSPGSRTTREQIAEAQKLAAELHKRIEASKSK